MSRRNPNNIFFYFSKLWSALLTKISDNLGAQMCAIFETKNKKILKQLNIQKTISKIEQIQTFLREKQAKTQVLRLFKKSWIDSTLFFCFARLFSTDDCVRIRRPVCDRE